MFVCLTMCEGGMMFVCQTLYDGGMILSQIMSDFVKRDGEMIGGV